MHGWTNLGVVRTGAAKVFEAPKNNPLFLLKLHNRYSDNPALSTDYGSEPVVTLLEVNIFAETKEAAVEKLVDVFGLGWPETWILDEIVKY